MVSLRIQRELNHCILIYCALHLQTNQSRIYKTNSTHDLLFEWTLVHFLCSCFSQCLWSAYACHLFLAKYFILCPIPGFIVYFSFCLNSIRNLENDSFSFLYNHWSLTLLIQILIISFYVAWPLRSTQLVNNCRNSYFYFSN